MLDKFLIASYGKQQRQEAMNKMASSFKGLTIDELKLIASEGVEGLEKKAYGLVSAECGPKSDDWLDDFRGTPLYDQALQLEQASIQTEMQQIQSQAQREAMMDSNREIYQIQDQIRLQKRLLRLQLHQMQGQEEAAAAAAQQATMAPPEAAAPMMDPAAAAPAPPAPAQQTPPPPTAGLFPKMGSASERSDRMTGGVFGALGGGGLGAGVTKSLGRRAGIAGTLVGAAVGAKAGANVGGAYNKMKNLPSTKTASVKLAQKNLAFLKKKEAGFGSMVANAGKAMFNAGKVKGVGGAMKAGLGHGKKIMAKHPAASAGAILGTGYVAGKAI